MITPDDAATELRERREAVAELGDQLRALTDAAVRTEVPAETIRQVAAAVADLAAPLAERARPVSVPPSVDDLPGGKRTYNPVVGVGNPIAPPLRLTITENGAVGECTLGAAYEGPPMYVHGGISALLLDQVLGHATEAIGNLGVTTDLAMRYRRPVPVDVPIRVWAEVAAVDERRTAVKGGITTAAEPDRQLVTATGTFLKLRGDQASRMFRGFRDSVPVGPDEAHD